VTARGAAWFVALVALGGCGRDATRHPATAASAAWGGVTPHPRNIQAGAVLKVDSGGNPYAANPKAVSIGADLFNRYNCDGCHGDGAAGSVGPSLADGRWRYGGTPREIYQSIYEGRPLGMPSYRAVANEPLWYLVSYVRSLADSTDHATQNAATWGGPPAR